MCFFFLVVKRRLIGRVDRVDLMERDEVGDEVEFGQGTI